MMKTMPSTSTTTVFAKRTSTAKRCNSNRAAAAPRASTPPVVQAAGAEKTVIITGASSGLGLGCAKSLADKEGYHVIMAVREYSKGQKAAASMGMKKGTYTIMNLDLASIENIHMFVDQFRATGRSLDCLICNAAVYLPIAKEPVYTADGFELSVGTNHLGHFLLTNLFLEDMKAAANARCIVVGSVTGNKNTLAGKVPPQADLGDLQGLKSGFTGELVMMDGGEFDGAKAYKDSKVANMMTMLELHRRYHESHGITFASLYPGCIAESGLFRNHNKFFQKNFPVLQKNLTKGYVSVEEAGRRLAAIVSEDQYNESGVYWSWKQGGDQLWENYNNEDRDGAYANEPSDEVLDTAKSVALWEESVKLVGLTA